MRAMTTTRVRENAALIMLSIILAPQGMGQQFRPC